MEQEPNQGATGDATTQESAGFDAGQGGQHSPFDAHPAADTPFNRPEVLVASAFVGGFAAAQILRWLGNR
jgi:hypothetical protein